MKRARILAKGLEVLGAGRGIVPIIWRSLRRPISPLAGEMPDRAEGGIDPGPVSGGHPLCHLLRPRASQGSPPILWTPLQGAACPIETTANARYIDHKWSF